MSLTFEFVAILVNAAHLITYTPTCSLDNPNIPLHGHYFYLPYTAAEPSKVVTVVFLATFVVTAITTRLWCGGRLDKDRQDRLGRWAYGLLAAIAAVCCVFFAFIESVQDLATLQSLLLAFCTAILCLSHKVSKGRPMPNDASTQFALILIGVTFLLLPVRYDCPIPPPKSFVYKGRTYVFAWDVPAPPATQDLVYLNGNWLNVIVMAIIVGASLFWVVTFGVAGCFGRTNTVVGGYIFFIFLQIVGLVAWGFSFIPLTWAAVLSNIVGTFTLIFAHVVISVDRALTKDLWDKIPNANT
ncbi:hypothetical protein BJ742DRAFT_816946 [Cladochytrium replicatum]|nr:hypothetical protein BJ742DRAFT_816946 [Cladochytrium replicatum]